MNDSLGTGSKFEGIDMITGSAYQEYVPFGRYVHTIHPGNTSKKFSSHSLSEGVNNISIQDGHLSSEGWQQRYCPDTDTIEELYFKECTVVWSTTSCSGQNRSSKIIKTFTVQGRVFNAFWCSFLLPRAGSAIDDDHPADEIQLAICIVESNAASIFTSKGIDHQVSLPFHVAGAWPMERGIIFQRSLDDKHNTKTLSQVPIWFTMLHPLGDLSPVICKSGGQLNYYTSHTHHLVHINTGSPYLAVMYDINTKSHSVHMIRRTAPEEEITYTELASTHGQHASMDISRRAHLISHSVHTPSRTGFLSLSSVLSPSIASPRGPHHIGSPSLRSANFTASPSTSRLTALSMNSPSLVSVHHLSMQNRSTMSPSAAVAHSPFTASGHCANQTQDIANQADTLEPIRPDVCLQHVWADNYSFVGRASKAFITTDFCGQTFLCLHIPAAAQLRCIKLGMSNAADGSVIFGTAVNIPAKDGFSCPKLNMMLVLDLESNVHLYSGMTPVSQLYIPRLSYSSQPAALTTPVRRGTTVLTSSRPPSAKEPSSSFIGPDTPEPLPTTINFGTEGMNWSPVQADLDDSSHFYMNQSSSYKCITAVSSVIKNHVILTLLNGELCRTTIPEMCSQPAVNMFVKALCSCLPYVDAISVISKWYTYNNNLTGSGTVNDELTRFFTFLLDTSGFSSIAVAQFFQNVETAQASPKLSKKRARTVHEPSEQDWNYLVDSSCSLFYRTNADLLGLAPITKETPELIEPMLPFEQSTEPSVTPALIKIKLDTKSILASQVHILLFLLHSCYEEMKLNTLYAQDLQPIAEFLLKFSQLLQLPDYQRIYMLDFPCLCKTDITNSLAIVSDLAAQSMVPPTWFPKSIQSTLSILESILSGLSPPVVYNLPGVTIRMEAILKVHAMYHNKSMTYADAKVDFIKRIPVMGRKFGVHDRKEELSSLSSCESTNELILHYMCEQGFTSSTLDTLPFGVTVVLREVMYACQCSPSTQWTVAALSLINREDIATLTRAHGQFDKAISVDNKDVTIDGMECLNETVLKMRWRDDLRMTEVKRCLRSSLPVRIALTQKPEVSDHNFIEEKEKHLLNISPRTVSLPLARGLLTFCSHSPILTQQLKIPTLCLTGKVLPTQSAVELSSDSMASMSVWPAFHNGAASGLSLDTKAKVDANWILYNKPKETSPGTEPVGYQKNLTSEHAGFLMALGLNGHLHNLPQRYLHDYLVKGHEMTAIGVLLGISATMRGTMDIPTVRLLTIHIPSLLPPSSTQLDIAHNARIAAMFGIGLVYHNSAHRHIAGVLLREIDHPPGQTKDHCADRESYSLSSGLALGMVMQGKGSDVTGLSDLSIANQLCLLMLGGHRTPDMMKTDRRQTISGQICEGELINTDVTSAGATLALGLIFFNLKSVSVCEWLKIPDTLYLLEFVRPDLLQLRIIAKNLVCWDKILPTSEWVEAQIPRVVLENAFMRETVDDNSTSYETLSQAYCYLTSGACFSMALKFAGSCNKSAYDCLILHTKKFIQLHLKPSKVDQSGKTIMENALCVCLVSLAMVMSGSGDLEVLKLCRYLRTRIGTPHVNYGSHMAVHISLALLFLGSGRYTLSSKPEVVPFLLAAFYPRFPSHSNDNRYHLQALRHLYALAAEPKLLFPINVDTNEPCYVPMEITLRPTDNYEGHSYSAYAPCLIPDIDLLQEVRVVDTRYWPVSFAVGRNLSALRKLLSNGGVMMVKRRAGHLDYTSDPQGIIGAKGRALLFDSENQACDSGKAVQGQSYCFQQLLLEPSSNETNELLMKEILRECLSNEKQELMSFYLQMHQMLTADITYLRGVQLQQLHFLELYSKHATNCVMNKHLFHYIHSEIKQRLLSDLSNNAGVYALLKYGLGQDHKNWPDQTWRYMSIKASITFGCISANHSIPAIVTCLGLPPRMARKALNELDSGEHVS